VTKSSSTFPKGFVFRVHLVTICIFAAGLLIIGRLSILQVKEHRTWAAKAASQQQKNEVREADRGSILLQDKEGRLQPAATDKHFPYVWANPSKVKDSEGVASILAPLLEIPKDELVRKLSKKQDPYELLAKRIPEAHISEVKNLKLDGVAISEERDRFYPGELLASNVIGFVSEDESGARKGNYGVEAAYDKVLRGGSGSAYASAGAFSFRGKTSASDSAGSNVVLTIDPNIQFEAERLLQSSMEKWRAKGGEVIVLESRTGKILALASHPTFNPNTFSKEKKFEVFLNRAVSLLYEPGSVFKPFTMAAGLESNAVTPETTYYDSGEVRFSGYTIRNAGNAAPKKEVSMQRILERSYNVGAVFVAQRVIQTEGEEYFKRFLLQLLGFDEKSGIDLPSEAKNDFRNLKPPEAKPINFATAAFGQGIAVTPIKLAQVFNAFANNGYLMRPYVVDKIIQSNGKVIVIEPERVRQAVSPKTLEALTPMLESVVAGEQGSGKLARIKGYRIAGKTGTGEIPLEHGRGYSDKVNHTFIGFGPVSYPKATILVRLEEPIGVRYAEATAVPVFRDLMKFILNYYGIPPDKPEEIEPTPQ